MPIQLGDAVVLDGAAASLSLGWHRRHPNTHSQFTNPTSTA
ncbi:MULTISPECIES: hypothetical protein [Actinomyces]|nr:MULTISPECIES: hypothetical protein [Actinomyces]